MWLWHCARVATLPVANSYTCIVLLVILVVVLLSSAGASGRSSRPSRPFSASPFSPFSRFDITLPLFCLPNFVQYPFFFDPPLSALAGTASR